MQPYFFPYLEHFRLMASCDLWVVFDTVAYKRRSWMNRNRILDRQRGWSYVTVPVRRSPADQPVCSVGLVEDVPWANDLRDHLRVYAHEAPHYRETLALVDAVLGTAPRTLTDLNVAGLRAVAQRLGITTEIRILSELRLSLPSRAAPGEWALHIARGVGATAYRNPIGGKQLFDPSRYAAAGIELSFHEPTSIRYATGSFEFVPDLSVLDVLMWASDAELAGFMRPSPGED
jgi:hypothetical protein